MTASEVQILATGQQGAYTGACPEQRRRDGNGARATQVTATGETIASHSKFYEKNLTTGEVTKSYYFGGKLVAQKKGTASLVYFHQDHLTGTSVMSDSAGASQGTVKYFPFGGTRSTSGTIPTDKKFTGQRLDGTGLYFYNARYYDAEIGRFVSADTLVPNIRTPQSLNRYSYVYNNPLKFKDPSGRCPECYEAGLGEIFGIFVSMNNQAAANIVRQQAVGAPNAPKLAPIVTISSSFSGQAANQAGSTVGSPNNPNTGGGRPGQPRDPQPRELGSARQAGPQPEYETSVQVWDDGLGTTTVTAQVTVNRAVPVFFGPNLGTNPGTGPNPNRAVPFDSPVSAGGVTLFTAPAVNAPVPDRILVDFGTSIIPCELCGNQLSQPYAGFVVVVSGQSGYVTDIDLPAWASLAVDRLKG